MNHRKARTVRTGAENTPKVDPLIKALLDRVTTAIGDDSVALIYQHQIRSDRTRRYELPPPAKSGLMPEVEIMHTLLGIELRVGRRRLACPDLSTARYLAVFARLGVSAVALPYDITRIARLADDLESAFYRMIAFADSEGTGLSDSRLKRLKKLLILWQREKVESIGPGPVAPQFNRR
ncbi:MAG: hypothetical protein EBU88_15580 [Acidobacteria bacterium]|nr:hypothetical protein [Acidobacteriota bacterium]